MKKYWYSKHFCENLKFFAKVFAFQAFRENENENLHFPNIFVKDTFSKHCHVLAVLSRLPVSAILSQLSGHRCHVQEILSWLICRVLTHLSCPDSSVLSWLVYPVLTSLSCPDSYVLSWLVCPVLTCLSCPDLSVLSWLTCPSCPPVPAALPRQHWPLLSQHLCYALAVLDLCPF